MSTAAQALAGRSAAWARAAWAWLALCLVLALAFPHLPGVPGAVTSGVVAVGTVAAVGVGLRRHRPAERRPWWCLGAACVLFLLGGVLRAADRAGAPLGPLLPAAATVPGYALVAVALVVWLRARVVDVDAGTVLDTALVGLGASLVSWAALVAPLTGPGRTPDWTLVVDATYPILDAVLLALLVHLAFTTAPGDRAFGLLAVALLALFAGDLGYAATTAGLVTLSPGLLDAPYLLCYGALGAGALHPSMTRLDRAQPRTAYRASRRLPGMVVTVVVSAVVLAALPTEGPLDRVVRAALFGALLLGVLLRSERAVRQHAAGEVLARYRASHDDLTGMPNRTRFHEVVGARLARPGADGQLCLLFLDLDGFKFVNDGYGHSVGDELLVAAAHRLTAAVGPDDVVARYGGDEFVVAAQLTRAGAEGLATRLVAVLSEPFDLGVGSVFVSASIGIARATAPSRTDDLEGLVREADAAMYHAKARGRGGYALFDESLRARAQVQVETSTALREALRRREFEVHYQPIVELRSGRTVGFEALLRWHHDGVTLSPEVFVPIAEASSIIVPIGEWVLREACTQLAGWWSAGHRGLHVAVNVSARQLREGDLLGTVSGVLAETGLPGEALWLELTETALVDDPAVALHTLQAVRDLGVVVCVDDFGTGYSALGYLQQFPISVVKIDGTFVRALGDSRPQGTTAGAVQSMSEALGLRTVAEGVESELQELQLRRLGCDMAQGFRFGHPRPAAQAALPPISAAG